MKKSVEKLVEHIEDVIENIKAKIATIENILERFDYIEDLSALLLRHSENKIETTNIETFLDEMGIEKFTKKNLRMAIDRGHELIRKVKELQTLFLTSEEELKTGDKHVASFYLLSLLLREGYKDNEVFEIIKEASYINDKTNIVDSIVYTIDKDRLESFKFETVTDEEKAYYLSTGTRTLLERTEELDENGKNFVEEILENLESLVIDNHDQNKIAAEKIIEILIYKENAYDESDIDELIEALKIMEAEDELCLIMRRCLERNLEKRRRKEIKQTVIDKNDIFKINSNTSKHYINDFEYRKLKKQVLEFYDLHTGELKKELSYEETLNIASIMIQLDYDKQEVYAFLIRALFNENKIESSNLLASFIHDYNKYIYYLGKESLLDILEYLKEMMIVNDEDYAYWKSGVEETINELNKQLPHKVDYEYELAKKM